MDDTNERFVQRQREAQALDKFVGAAPAFRKAIATVTVAARSEAPVLVTGETGTGKELVARAVHYLSSRAAEPFVAVNCGSLTDTLLEDELFGHERGAFTDASHRHLGLIAQAQRGTLFLDEIDTLTMRGQVALLRVLQDQVYRPLGAEREYQAHVRFVTATNAALAEVVDSGAFRADLYYRVSVFTVSLPPLRERREDILPLANHLLKKHAPDGDVVPVLAPAAQSVLMEYDWPGNVRELENAMVRAGRLCGNATIEVEHLHLPRATALPCSTASRANRSRKLQPLKAELIHNFEHEYLQRLMREAAGNVSHAAKIAGKDRRDLGKLLKKHGLMGASSRRTG